LIDLNRAAQVIQKDYVRAGYERPDAAKARRLAREYGMVRSR
jgi:hypothetical protein